MTSRNDEMKIREYRSLVEFVGYLKSWSDYGTYTRAFPDKKDPADILIER